MRERITKRVVDGLAAGDAAAMVWDTEVAGFGVRWRGGAAVYLVRYRAGRGRGAPIRTVTIGRHGAPWTPDTARVEAKRILGAAAGGADPASMRAAERTAPMVADLIERFLAEHADAKRKPRTAVEYRRLMALHVLPALGNRKVASISRADVAKLHHAGRATPYQANRVLAVLSKAFALAEVWGLRPDGSNPCRGVERYREAKREAMLTAAELARLGDALAAHRGPPAVVAAIRLLIFTGARLSEILGLRWGEVDLERGEARLADSKTGAKTLHLPPPALRVLTALPRIDGNPFVITGHRAGAPLINLQKPWRAIRTAAGLPSLRVHDLRHAFASVGAGAGLGLPIIGKLLGHSQPATTARYAHIAADPAKAAAAAIAGQIEGAMERANAEVVRLPKKG